MSTFSLFPHEYNFEFKDWAQPSEEVAIIVSSTAKPAFYKSEFKRPTLYICDNSSTYYTKGADILSVSLVRFLRIRGFTKVFMTGISKGGFGALRIGSLAAGLAADISFRSIVFSPQTVIYPYNSEIEFPSYKYLLKRSENDAEIRHDLQKFGSLAYRWPSNFISTIYVSGLNNQDVRQANLVRDYASIVELPLSGHLSHLPFAINIRNEAAIRLIVDRAMSQGQQYGDAMSIAERDAFIAELIALGKTAEWDNPPNLTDLASQEFLKMKQLEG